MPSNALSLNVLSLKKDVKRFNKLTEKYHYMGEGLPAGDTMRIAVEADGKWVALLLWGSAAYRLKGRDEWIGWTAQQRAKRQKLVVQNRRFVILSKPGSYANLASRVLGQALRELPELWEREFGYPPLLAETFCDVEARAGTCYKASNWIELGETKGYSRHSADFYVPNDRPKKLWVKPLHEEARQLLRAPELPAAYSAGATSDDDGVMPLKTAQIESLRDAFRSVPDPRAANTKFKIHSLLSIMAMAIFSGHRNLVQVVRFAERMTLQQRAAVWLPRRRGSKYIDVPSYNTYYNLLRKLDVDEFAKVLSKWLQQHNGTLPVALAMDGKFIRDTVGIVCLADHQTGVPRAMARASKKEGEGKDCELKVAQRMVSNMPSLDDTIITADALHCQRKTARDIVERGGDYVLQVKDNQKTVRKQADQKTNDGASPFLA